MSKAIKIEIKESFSELRTLMRQSISMISVRINMLVKLKKHDGCLSRRKLSVMLGVSDKSIQTWRKVYLDGGLPALLKHEKKGRDIKVFNDEERKFIEDTLSNPENGVQGYKELQRLMFKQFGKDFAYTTLVGYCKNQFGSKIKVARPSHVKKDEKAMSDFKKTLVNNSKRLLKMQAINTRKYRSILKTKVASD
jgi:transposase